MYGVNQKSSRSTLYLLLDSSSNLLAKGDLQSPPDAVNMQIRIAEGLADDVVAAETVQAVPLDHTLPILLGRVILRRGNNVVLEPMRKLSGEVRRAFRMPVSFESFVYPLDGTLRSVLLSLDLSCGGIAFYSTCNFQVGEDFEIVIPITSGGPLLVIARVLRVTPYQGPIRLYAAKFMNLLKEEEELIQEAVFSVQMDSIRLSKRKGG